MEPIVRTFPSGQYVNLLEMNPDHIHIEDIAHQLALTNRYNGATRFPYSVAAHSIYMARYMVKPKNAFAALMHDSPEAYLGDLVKPLKEQIPQFKEIEDNLWRVIAKKFGIPEELPEDVHQADKLVLCIEKYHLRDERFYQKVGVTEQEILQYPKIREFLSWKDYKSMFLTLFTILSNDT